MRLRKVINNHLVIERMDRKELAEQLGWNQSTMTRWLNGKGGLSSDHLAKLIRWLLEEEA